MRTAVDDPDPGPVAWRLLGRNHRELGRSLLSYPDMAAARAAVVELQAVLDTAVATVLVEPATRMWTWRVWVDDVGQLAASRSFQRRRESTSNVARALEALGSADFVANELVLHAARHRPLRPPPPVAVDPLAPDVA